MSISASMVADGSRAISCSQRLGPTARACPRQVDERWPRDSPFDRTMNLVTKELQLYRQPTDHSVDGLEILITCSNSLPARLFNATSE